MPPSCSRAPFSKRSPHHPLGYLLEGEALWWKRYCAACEIKYGMIEAWKREKRPEDEAYLAVGRQEIVQLAKAQLAKSETAEMHFYRGNGLRAEGARLRLAQRESQCGASGRERARPKCCARSSSTRRWRTQPPFWEFTTITWTRFLRHREIPSLLHGYSGRQQGTGSETDGNRNEPGNVLCRGCPIHSGRALRQYDQKYEQALEVAEPLVARYPQNPLFQLLLGNLNAELGRNAKAAEYFRRCAGAGIGFVVRRTAARNLANSFLQALH